MSRRWQVKPLQDTYRMHLPHVGDAGAADTRRREGSDPPSPRANEASCELAHHAVPGHHDCLQRWTGICPHITQVKDLKRHHAVHVKVRCLRKLQCSMQRYNPL